MGRPYLALAVGCTGNALFDFSSIGCTGNALFGISSRLHWVIRLGLGLRTVSTLKQTAPRLGLGTVSTLKQTTRRCRWIHGLHYKCLIRVKTSKMN